MTFFDSFANWMKTLEFTILGAYSNVIIRKRPRITRRTTTRSEAVAISFKLMAQAWMGAQLCGRSSAIRVMG